MRKKKPVKASLPNAPTKVRCIAEDTWAGGAGFLAIGDEAVLTYERAVQLIAEKKVEAI